MQPRTLTLPDEESYRQLVRLAEAAGLHVGPGGLVSKTNSAQDLPLFRPHLTEAERQHHLAIVARGGDGTSIADPLAWQREIRQDRPLPGRDQ